MDEASSGVSPKDSYVRPHRSLRATHRQGAKSQSTPVPETSSATARPTRCASAGSRVAPSPMLCGKIVAPTTLLWSCTASTPYRMGMPSGVARAAFWKLSYMSPQDAAVFGDGPEPPPDSPEPSRYVVTSAALTEP